MLLLLLLLFLSYILVLCNVCKKFPIKVVSSFFNRGMMPFLNKPLSPYHLYWLPPSSIWVSFVRKKKFLCFMLLQRLLGSSLWNYSLAFSLGWQLITSPQTFIHVFQCWSVNKWFSIWFYLTVSEFD